MVMTWNFDHFSKWNIQSVKNLHTFKNSYSIMTKNKNVMHWGNFEYFLEQVTKHFIQKFICK